MQLFNTMCAYLTVEKFKLICFKGNLLQRQKDNYIVHPPMLCII
jgi:hypothetical protein